MRLILLSLSLPSIPPLKQSISILETFLSKRLSVLILLGESLLWKYHFTELFAKLARTGGMFFKVRHFLPINALIFLYNSLFSPFFQYGILVRGLTYETYINPVFLLPKRVIRAIAFENFTSHSAPIFSD